MASLLALPIDVLLLIVVPLNRWDTSTLMVVNKQMHACVEKSWALKVRYRLESRLVVGDVKTEYIRSLQCGVPVIRRHDDGRSEMTIPRRDVVKLDYSHNAAVVATIDGECWLYCGKVRLLNTGVTDCLIAYLAIPQELYCVWLVKNNALEWIHLDAELEEKERVIVPISSRGSPVSHLCDTHGGCVTCLLENGDVVIAFASTGGAHSVHVLETNVRFYYWSYVYGKSLVKRDGTYYGSGTELGCSNDVKKYISHRDALVLTDNYIPCEAVQFLTKDVRDITSYHSGYYTLMRDGLLKRDDGSTVDTNVVSVMSSCQNNWCVVCYIVEPE
jgi:hypothetical protein